MSTLLIDQLFSGVEIEQPFTIDRNISVAHIRPWIMKFGALVTGDLKLEIKQASTTLATKTINYTDIESEISDPYAHGFIRFDFESLALHVSEGNTTEDYTLVLSMINYSNDSNGYLSFIRAWDVPIYTSTDNPPNDTTKPFGFEIYIKD